MYRKLLAMTTAGLLLSGTALAHTPPAKARLFIAEPQDGAIVHNPFKVKFGLHGYKVVPAGAKGRERHRGGHHHLLIDTALPDLDEAIPRDGKHLHFDSGETYTVLSLPPGRHTLRLLLGDEQHEPHDPPLISQPITITVK
jgi:hypothetical protein